MCRLPVVFFVALAWGLLQLSTSAAMAAWIEGENFRSDDGSYVPVISIAGELVAADVLRFEDFARNTTGRAVVLLNSPGGSLEAGIGIGRAIHRFGYATAVAETCASACALAWLAGRIRMASPTSRIGFHVAYRGVEARQESGAGNALVGLYLAEIGMGENVVRYVTTAAPGEMQWLTKEIGAESAAIIVVGGGFDDGKTGRFRNLIIGHDGNLNDEDEMFGSTAA